jgi:hypothetical protein
MTTSGLRGIDRRMAIGGALAGTAGLALPRRQTRTVTQRGMVGGGLVQFEQGEANFSLFVSRLIYAEDDAEVIVGIILWVDGVAGITLWSSAVTEYIVPEVQPEQGVSRRIIGTMSVNGEGEHPFELEVIDVDLPGSGKDTVDLKVGDGARASDKATPTSGLGSSYTAAGTVATGDIQELVVEMDLATGVVRLANE